MKIYNKVTFINRNKRIKNIWLLQGIDTATYVNIVEANSIQELDVLLEIPLAISAKRPVTGIKHVGSNNPRLQQ